MIDYFSWETAHLYGEAWISHHRLRHKLFIDRQGWQVPSYNGLEYDQYDTPAAVYLVWRDDKGQARATTRLLPTERPYMLQELWPDMVTREALPRAANVWEATRIGVDRDLDAESRNRAAGEIVAGCLEYGLRHGIDRYVFLMPLVIIKSLLVRSGCPVAMLREPRSFGDHLVAAAEVRITQSVLNEVRRRKNLKGPVLNIGVEPMRKAA